MEQSGPGITSPLSSSSSGQQEIVRDQPFVRLPTGTPHTATELAIRKPTLPASYVPPTSLVGSSLPSPSYAPPAFITTEPRSDTKKWVLAFAAVAALLSIGALVAFLFTRRPGGLQIEVKDAAGATVPKAEVYVDGRRICEATPCSVRDLDVGRHSVKVMTPSDETVEPVNVDIEAGSMTPVTFTLKAQFAQLVASSDQVGVHLFVDNVDKGTLPAKLADVAPGKHELALKGERYKTFERTIEVKAGETLELEVPKLSVLKGRATVNVKTEGVSITVVRTDEKAPVKVLDGPYPRTIEVDTSGKWQLVAKKKGLPDFTASLDFPDGVSERTIDVELKDDKDTKDSKDKEKEEEPSAKSKTPTPVVAGVRPTPEPRSKKDKEKEKETEEPDPATASAPSGTGTLNINSIPASRVLLDGSPLGETPRTGVSVSAGTHTVTFIHPELGKKSVTVKVGPGETKTASAKLRAD